jgi:hypothetical protein
MIDPYNTLFARPIGWRGFARSNDSFGKGGTLMRTTRLFHLAITAALLLAVAVPAGAAVFEITIENLSPNVLTPAVFITHDAGIDLFDLGAAASPELELLAEDGVPDGLVDLATAELGTTVTDVVVAAGPLLTGESAVVMVETDPAHPLLSFASMLAVSNDAFIGNTTGDGAIDLFPGGIPVEEEVLLIDDEGVWDAGTEVNDEEDTTVPGLGGGDGVDEDGVITLPHPGIVGIGDIPLDADWTPGDVAKITITPEPSTMLLLSAGALAMIRRRRKLS